MKKIKLDETIKIPKDRATINAWCRSFYALNPSINAQIEEYKTGTLKHINEDIDLTLIDSMLTQLFVCGEVFVSDEMGSGEFAVLNPDYVMVNKSDATLGKTSVNLSDRTMKLRPDENIRRICTSNDPSDIETREKFDKRIVQLIRMGKNIPLNRTYHAAIKMSPYELRGTSIMVPHLERLAKGEDVNMLPSGLIGTDVFRTRCRVYAAHINALISKMVKDHD